MVRQVHCERLGNRFAVVLSGERVRESGGRAVFVVCAVRGENSDFSAHFRAFPLKSANGSTGLTLRGRGDWYTFGGCGFETRPQRGASRRWSDRFTVSGLETALQSFYLGSGFVNRVVERSLLSAPPGVKILIFPTISERFHSYPPMLRRAHHDRRGGTGSPLVEAGLKPVATLSMPRMVRRAHRERIGNRFAVVLSGVLFRESGGRAVLVACGARGENSDFSDHFRAFPLKSANASTGLP